MEKKKNSMFMYYSGNNCGNYKLFYRVQESL